MRIIYVPSRASAVLQQPRDLLPRQIVRDIDPGAGGGFDRVCLVGGQPAVRRTFHIRKVREILMAGAVKRRRRVLKHGGGDPADAPVIYNDQRRFPLPGNDAHLRGVQHLIEVLRPVHVAGEKDRVPAGGFYILYLVFGKVFVRPLHIAESVQVGGVRRRLRLRRCGGLRGRRGCGGRCGGGLGSRRGSRLRRGSAAAQRKKG